MLRVLDELLWRLRREGFRIPTSSAIDAVAAVRVVGVDDPNVLRATLIGVLVKSTDDLRLFDRGWRAFFATAPRTLRERLLARGFTEAELALAFEALATLGGNDAESLGRFLDHGTDLDRLLSLAGMERSLAPMSGPLQRGFFVHRALERAGAGGAWRALGALRTALRDAMGARADALVTALASEIEAGEDVVRTRVSSRAERAAPPHTGRIADRAIASLDRRELRDVQRSVRELASRLRGAARVRRKRARRGRIDPHRTLRQTFRTLGVPMSPAHVRRRRDKPRLVLLCDVSDSVRDVSSLLLEFVYAAHELFEQTRSFVFVSDVGEASALFRTGSPEAAIAAAHGGAVVPVTGNSNYGAALRAFVDRFIDAVDCKTTVVVLGDGRTNYHDTGEASLERLAARAKTLLWICPDARERWAEGDSAMIRYAEICTEVHEVRTVRDLERAARAVTRRF
jgi:uncharacterized protein with von Willebrand factor type A (vWA) domain